MHKTFLEFNDRAIASGIQKGAPALAGYLKVTAERLNELAKNSTEESDAEEDENDAGRSIRPVAPEPRSRPQGRVLGPGAGSALGYQAGFGEEEDEEDEDAGEIAAPSVPFQLDNLLPLSDWTGTENIQQLRNKGPQSNTQGRNNIRPVPARHNLVDVLDNKVEQFLRSKGLYRDGQYSVPFSPIDPSLGSDEKSLASMSSPYYSPSLNSSGGPHTPRSTDVHWPNETYSRRNHIFSNESTNVPKTSDTDMGDYFDNAGIRP